jgi:hypothetical protein
MPPRERVVPQAGSDDGLWEKISEIHRAIVGTVDGSHPGIHRRLDGFESISKDHEERITDLEDHRARFDKVREERGATLADHDTRLKALEDAKSSGLGWWKAAGVAVIGGIVSQIFRIGTELLQAGAHATPPHH